MYESHQVRSPEPFPLRLSRNHGYRLEGDRAFLNAELALDDLAGFTPSDWALQLWACDVPHEGGPVRGVKVAEAPLSVPLSVPPERAGLAQLEAETVARLPPVQRDYAMVLVLASGAHGVYDQVHDFSNYPARQQFEAPSFDGSVGYRIDGDRIVLQAERVRNPRPADNLSGSLLLELWALERPYDGEEPQGSQLAAAELERLPGQAASERSALRVPFSEPPAGIWQVALLLREWTAEGYVTRDYCNFAQPYRAPATSATLATPADTAVSAAPAVQLAQPPAAASRTAQPAPALEAPAFPPAAPPAVSAPEPLAPPAPTSPSDAERVATSAPSLPPSTHTAPPAAATPAPTAHASATTVARPALVSIQHASVQQLAAVRGLNPKVAAAIVRARPFSSLDELKRVRGIGDRMVSTLRAYLTL